MTYPDLFHLSLPGLLIALQPGILALPMLYTTRCILQLRAQPIRVAAHRSSANSRQLR